MEEHTCFDGTKYEQNMIAVVGTSWADGYLAAACLIT